MEDGALSPPRPTRSSRISASSSSPSRGCRKPPRSFSCSSSVPSLLSPLAQILQDPATSALPPGSLLWDQPSKLLLVKCRQDWLGVSELHLVGPSFSFLCPFSQSPRQAQGHGRGVRQRLLPPEAGPRREVFRLARSRLEHWLGLERGLKVHPLQ